MSGGFRPEHFGIGADETRQMAARAEGAHVAEQLWKGTEAIFGNIKVQRQSHAYDQLQNQFPGHGRDYEQHLDR